MDFSKYTKIIVTGVYYQTNKRFKPKVYENNIAGRLTAFGINLWKGSRWGLLPNGKRVLLQRVYN